MLPQCQPRENLVSSLWLFNEGVVGQQLLFEVKLSSLFLVPFEKMKLGEQNLDLKSPKSLTQLTAETRAKMLVSMSGNCAPYNQDFN